MNLLVKIMLVLIAMLVVKQAIRITCPSAVQESEF